MIRKKRNERLVVLTVGGILAVNYPWVALFSTGQLLFGIPSLYLYLFLVWGIFIALVARLIDTEDSEQNGTSATTTHDSDFPHA
jgi:4-hydroxybenzoate polyprenyltransferase